MTDDSINYSEVLAELSKFIIEDGCFLNFHTILALDKAQKELPNNQDLKKFLEVLDRYITQ